MADDFALLDERWWLAELESAVRLLLATRAPERSVPTPDAELGELWLVLKQKRGSRRG